MVPVKRPADDRRKTCSYDAERLGLDETHRSPPGPRRQPGRTAILAMIFTRCFCICLLLTT
jgi:hypothetical protein